MTRRPLHGSAWGIWQCGILCFGHCFAGWVCGTIQPMFNNKATRTTVTDRREVMPECVCAVCYTCTYVQSQTIEINVGG